MSRGGSRAERNFGNRPAGPRYLFAISRGVGRALPPLWRRGNPAGAHGATGSAPATPPVSGGVSRKMRPLLRSSPRRCAKGLVSRPHDRGPRGRCAARGHQLGCPEPRAEGGCQDPACRSACRSELGSAWARPLGWLVPFPSVAMVTSLRARFQSHPVCGIPSVTLQSRALS